jgi:hypothetical protein
VRTLDYYPAQRVAVLGGYIEHEDLTGMTATGPLVVHGTILAILDEHRALVLIDATDTTPAMQTPLPIADLIRQDRPSDS